MIKYVVIVIVVFCPINHVFASDITVVVTGITVNQGRIYVGLYDTSREFPNGRQKAGQFVDSKTQKIRIIFTDLAHGKYAFAVFQDKNANEKLDKNLLGIPKENYGFSGESVLTSPDFEDAAVEIKSTNQQIEININ